MKCKSCDTEINEKSKTGYCNRCYPKTEEAKLKNSAGLRKAFAEGRKNSDHFKINHYGPSNSEWHLLHPESVEKQKRTLKENIASGKTVPTFKGKKHSVKTRELMSQKATGGKDGFVKTKYYEIFCPYTNETVTVQGTWELKYCSYLNEQKINWIRDRKKNLRFRYSDDDIKRTYYPDLYLPDLDAYIEIKGYFSEHDKLKMEKVKEHNLDKDIQILQKEDLEKLGIVLY